MLKSSLIVACLFLAAPAMAQAILPIPHSGQKILTPSAAEADRKAERQNNPARKAIREACQADIQSLCGDVERGEGRIAQCMRSKREQISEGCRSAMKQGRQERQASKQHKTGDHPKKPEGKTERPHL